MQLLYKFDLGVYVGQGGAAYALWYVASRPGMERHKERLLTEARLRIDYHSRFAEKVRWNIV